MKFFGRAIRLQVEDQDMSNFDCEFTAKKTLIPMQPNTLKMQIYNLNPAHRKSLETKKNYVRLDAGYTGIDGKSPEFVQVFQGQVRSAYSLREKNNWITYLDTGDSFMEIALAQINTSMGPKVGVGSVMQELAKSMGIKSGNLNAAIAKFGNKLDGKIAAMGKRALLVGNAAKLMTDHCDSAGLEWSVQDGELQILEKGKTLEGTGVKLTPETGLIGSPSLELKSAGSFSNQIAIAKSVALSKPGHVITATSLINPGLRVGGKVVFDTAEIKAAYRILQLEYSGNTRGQDWYVKLTGSHYTQ